MSTKNPNYYQEENINNDGVIPTRKWATEGQSPSVGLSMDNTGYLFNSNLNQGYGITNPDAELLEKINIEVVYEDERLTTVMAHNILSENNVRGKKRKETVDAVSAVMILQSYLDKNR